jgi:hypothetical protein
VEMMFPKKNKVDPHTHAKKKEKNIDKIYLKRVIVSQERRGGYYGTRCMRAKKSNVMALPFFSVLNVK